MAFPSEITKQIASYLSPHDLGRVAQLNKSWRNLVYSNSCWNLNKLWDVKHESRGEFYSEFDIPSNARHIGEPTQLCFYDWLTRSPAFINMVPFCIVESNDFSVYVSYLHKIWKHSGCPCVHTNHYKWYDVFRGREFLVKLSAADQQRVFYRHCNFIIDRKIVDTNPYRFWLQNYNDLTIHTHTPFLQYTPRSDHPADIIVAATKNKEYKRISYVHQRREAAIQRFQTSIQKLRIYGKKEFEKKDEEWSELFPHSEKRGL